MIKNIIKHLQVPKRFILNIGISPAILLSELLNKERFLLSEWKLEKDDYFFHEYKYIYKNTGLLKNKFSTARKKLESLWIIQNKYWEGKRLLYNISENKLLDIFFPKSKNELIEDDFIELILEDWYIFYPAVLSHKIWINETIFIKSLLSKRKSFLSKNQLKNWYFFNSVSNIKNDTSLSRDQQLKCIKNLVEISLLDVKYDYDNTRYFCINISLLSKFESIELNDVIKVEVLKGDKVEGWKNIAINNKRIVLNNPFLNREDWKNDEVENWINDEIDVLKHDNTDVWIIDAKKDDNTISRNKNKLLTEDWKDYINKNKKENKEIKRNNNNKILLLSPFFQNRNIIENLSISYSEDEIKKVINEVNKKNVENPAGFIKWALDNKIDFSTKKELLNKKIEKSKIKNHILDNKEMNETFKILEQKKVYLNWKNTNKELYNKIFEKNKEEFNIWNINTIKLNINSEIKTKKFIIEKYIN